MNELQNLFTSEKNADLIIELSIKNILEKNGLIIDKNDTEFFEIFNVIASSVFKHEKNKYTGISTRDSLISINRIVVNEIVRYTIEKYLSNQNTPETLKKEVRSVFTNTETLVELEEYSKIVCIDKLDKPLELKDLNNVVSIQLLKLSIYPEIYNITKNNNVIAIDGVLVQIKEGRYNRESLLFELCRKVKEITEKDISFTLDETTNLVSITSMEIFNIDTLRSTILPILGFSLNINCLENSFEYTSRFPMFLNINNRIDAIIDINSVNLDCVNIFNIPLILDTTKEVDVIDLSENINKFKGTVISSIKLSLDNYIDRQFPVSCLLKITRIKVI
jgi:hypothetical protein